VNHLGTHGRWAASEFTDVFAMEEEFQERVSGLVDALVQSASESSTPGALAGAVSSGSDL